MISLLCFVFVLSYSPAQRVVILHPLDLVLQLLDPTQDVHVLLLQHAKPQFIPQ